MFDEVKSTSKIVLRSKNPQKQSPLSDPFMLVSSIGCLTSIYMKSQYLLFGFLIVLLSCFLNSKKKSIGINGLMPLYGLMPTLIKMTIEVVRCLVTGEPL